MISCMSWLWLQGMGSSGEFAATICRRGERACGDIFRDRFLCGERGYQERIPFRSNAPYADPPWDSAVACSKQPDDLKGIFQQHQDYGKPHREYHHGAGVHRGRGSGGHRKFRLCNKPCVPDPVGDPIAYHTGMRIFHHLHRILPVPENNGNRTFGGDRLFHPCREPDSEQHLCQVF